MQIQIVVTEARANFLSNYKFLSGEVLLVKPAPVEFKRDMWEVTILFPDYYTPELACMSLFSAGVTCGLELQYDMYDNNIPR